MNYDTEKLHQMTIEQSLETVAVIRLVGPLGHNPAFPGIPLPNWKQSRVRGWGQWCILSLLELR